MQDHLQRTKTQDAEGSPRKYFLSSIEKMPYEWMPVEQVESMIPTLVENGVSEVARSPRGFIRAYGHFRTPMQMAIEFVPGERVTWAQKRELFIRRTLAAYKKNPSYRRALSLMAWAFMPKDYRVADIFKLQSQNIT